MPTVCDFLKEAGVDEAVLTLKSLEAFEKAADGKATEDHHSVRDSGRGRSREIAGRKLDEKRDRKRGITVAHNTRDRGEYHRPDRSMEAGRTEAKSRQPKRIRRIGKRPWMIALDGMCASGKTTLAGKMKERYPELAVIHMDDFFPATADADARAAF